jgi:hypothetical protein
MSEALSTLLGRNYRRNHDDLLTLVRDLEEGLFARRPAPANSIAFNVWHLARWADHLQSILSEMTPDLQARLGKTPERWDADNLAQRWGMDRAQLGHAQTGMGMDEEVSARLSLPQKEVLIDYAQRTFAAAQRAVDSVRDADLTHAASVDLKRATWLPGPAGVGTVGSWIVGYLRHDAQHLGMVQTLRSVQGASQPAGMR